MGRPTIAQTEEGVFHSEEWIAILGLILANCMWLADLLANRLAKLKDNEVRSAPTSLLRQLTSVSILRSRIQIDYDLFIVNKHRGV